MKIGAYMPTTFGYSNAIKELHSYGGNCIMVYTGSPKSFHKSTIDLDAIAQAELTKKELGFGETIIHAPYIMNPANPDPVKRDRARARIIEEIKRTEQYKSNLLVVHPGNYLSSTPRIGIQNLAETLNYVTEEDSNVTICIETMAGKGTEIITDLSHFSALFSELNRPERIGICLDTCHMHDSGDSFAIEDQDRMLTEIDQRIGLDKVKVIHVNGSKNGRGSGCDRHANIGIPGTDDQIGAENLRAFCQRPEFENVPKILETPWNGDTNYYKQEIALLSSPVVHSFQSISK